MDPPACGPKDLVPVRLGFLAETMAKNYLSIPKVANAVGFKGSTIRHWFHVDDIQVNNVKKFADAFGFEFTYSFVSNEDTTTKAEDIAMLLKLICDLPAPMVRSIIEAISMKKLIP